MRLLLLGLDPAHLSVAERDHWLREQTLSVTELPEVASIRIVPLRRAHPDHDKPFDWLIELDVDDTAIDELFERRPIVELLSDLRQLGMRPQLVVAGEG